MSQHPINLALRFILELSALVALGISGYRFFEGGLGVLAAVMLPLGFAVTWGVFAVREDPSRSGKTVVATPGPVRLVLELVLFGISAGALLLSGYVLTALIFGIAVIVHYLLSLDRIKWLMHKK